MRRVLRQMKPLAIVLATSTSVIFMLWIYSAPTPKASWAFKFKGITEVKVHSHRSETARRDVVKESSNGTSLSYPGISRYDHVTVAEVIYHETRHMPVPSKEKIRGFIDDPVERFDEKPPKFFIKSWKNPCWYERTTQLDAALQRIFTLRCLPAFYIAGFPKCGTTDIWYRILQHPQVANFTKRESHWWSTTKWYMKGNISEYINVYSKAMIDREAEKRPNLIIGDDSPSYMWMQNFRMINTILVRDLLKMEVTPPEVLTPHLIREYSPRAKFIVMLRDPIERLYSHYLDKGFISANLVSRRAMRSLLGFHSQVVQKTALFYDCLKRKPIRTCAHDPFIFRENNEFLVRLERGLYSVYIAEWLKIFPREQFLFLRVEDYAKDVSKTLKEVFSFLEIDQLEDSKHRDIVAAEVANQAKKKGDDVIGPMWNITRDILEEFYRPFNVALAGILGDKRYMWDD